MHGYRHAIDVMQCHMKLRIKQTTKKECETAARTQIVAGDSFHQSGLSISCCHSETLVLPVRGVTW